MLWGLGSTIGKPHAAVTGLQPVCRYTVCHVAAQYGQTAFLYHVALRWGADIDCLDSGSSRRPCYRLYSSQHKGHKGAVSRQPCKASFSSWC